MNIDEAIGDARYALRTLRRSPGFAAVAIAMLALGIGIDAAVFTVANAVLFNGPPFIDRSDRIVYINTRDNHGDERSASWPDFQDWRARARSFAGLAAVNGLRIVLSENSEVPEVYDATQVTANTFQLLGQGPALGRDFVPADEIPGAAPVTILSHGFWQRRFAGDQAIVGRTVRIDGAATTVIGVMPPGFSFPRSQDLWLPLAPPPDRLERADRNALWFVIARLADDVSIELAGAEMATIGRQLAGAWPLTNQGFVPTVQRQFVTGPNAPMVYGSLWGAVGFVLLIACANLANLLLARAIGRSREIAVRIALGAGRGRIVRQLLVESLMLSGIGGLLGWWIARWGVWVYRLVAVPDWKQPWFDFTMDYRVAAYLVALSLGTAILFGLAPALRLASLDVNTALKDGGRGAGGGARGKRLSARLVIGEMALAVVLLAAAGVMIRSFLKIQRADVGAQTANLLVGRLQLPEARYPDAGAQIAFYDRLETALGTIPGVQSIALASSLPTWPSLKLAYEIAGAPPADPQRRPTLAALIVGPGYFRTVGAAVLSGREFDDGDRTSGVQVAIVNRRFAAKFWPGEDPRGKRLRLFDGTTPDAWRTVVGVVSNIVQNDHSRQELDPLVYVPYRQRLAGPMNIIARTAVPPNRLAGAVQREVQLLDPALPVYSLGTMSDSLAGSTWDIRINSVLFLLLAAMALLLASVGLYAVIGHSLGQRTQEIGIRMAMGATARDILTLVLRQGMRPVAIGLIIGLAASFAVNRLLQAELVQVSPADPLTLAFAAGTLIVAATLGCWIPARRAMRVDPAIALRDQ